MAAMRILLAVCVMAAWVSVASSKAPSHSPSPVPAPSPSDCSTTVVYNMATCLSFLGKDSKVTKPSSSCCSGFKSVVHVGFECICTAVNIGARMGLDLNMTKSDTLPSTCGVPSPPISGCIAKPKPTVSPMLKAPSPVSPPSHPSSPAKPPLPSAKAPAPSAKPPSAKAPVPSAKPPSAKAPAASPGGGSGTPQVAPTPSTSGSYRMSSAPLTFIIIISMLVASSSLVSA